MIETLGIIGAGTMGNGIAQVCAVAGVPVITCLGQSFAGRVAASALRAVDMEELVTASLADYERLACELGSPSIPLSPFTSRRVTTRLI